ncbi:hypothetical protein F5Y14DRAFT_372095 [Nemania sp. NC0429]|nr:hypothetical protein F5Y14DRAFT_372095 [Nemania sp. NC0429]
MMDGLFSFTLLSSLLFLSEYLSPTPYALSQHTEQNLKAAHTHTHTHTHSMVTGMSGLLSRLSAHLPPPTLLTYIHTCRSFFTFALSLQGTQTPYPTPPKKRFTEINNQREERKGPRRWEGQGKARYCWCWCCMLPVMGNGRTDHG